MLLIVLGESVLAIGVGVGSGETAIGVAQVVFAAVSLGLAALLYWAYFGTHEDEAAEHALERVAPERQQAVALGAFGYAFVVVLQAGGVGATCVGFRAFRRAVGRSAAGRRAVGGVVLVAATWLGALSGFVELLALIAGSVALLLLERRQSARRG